MTTDNRQVTKIFDCIIVGRSPLQGELIWFGSVVWLGPSISLQELRVRSGVKLRMTTKLIGKILSGEPRYIKSAVHRNDINGGHGLALVPTINRGRETARRGVESLSFRHS